MVLCFQFNSIGQSYFCNGSEPFCTGTNYEFPAGTGGDAEPGPYYDCLYTQPNPAWYHMKIADPGDIIIYMYSNPSEDIDFICWGPFDDAHEPCVVDLIADKVVDCSYSAAATETCSIPWGQTGEYYILLITNYSNDPCNIIFSQTGGIGTTDCSILPPEASSNSPICVGDTIELYAATVSGATYEWIGPDSFFSTEQNPVIPDAIFDNSGTYSCTIFVGTQNNSTDVIVEVLALPTAIISGNEEICPGDNAQIVFHLTGTAPWIVQYTNGTNIFSFTSQFTPAIENVSPGSTTIYTLTGVTDAACIGNEFSGTAIVMMHPDILVKNVEAECNLANTHYTVSFEITGGDPSTYYVTPDEGNISSGPPYIFTSDPIPESTPYQYFIGDAFDCMTLPVSGIQSCQCPASAEISGIDSICPGEEVLLTIDFVGTSPWTVIYTQNGADPQEFTTIENPHHFNVTPVLSTNYAISYVEDFYCEGTGKGSAQVVVNAVPNADFLFDNVCEGEALIFTDISSISSGIITNWFWDFGDGGNSSIQNPSHTYGQSGNYNVELNVTSDHGCSSSVDNSVSVYELSTAYAGKDTTIYYQTIASLTGTVSGGSGNWYYNWMPDNLVLDPQSLNTNTVPLEQDIAFILTTTDQEYNCIASDTVNVFLSGAPLQIQAIASPPLLCLGESTILGVNITGGNEIISYHWVSDPPGYEFFIKEPIVAPEETTIFSVTVSDNLTSVAGEIKVEVVPLPEVYAGTDQSIPHGWSAMISATVSNGTYPFEYQWTPEDMVLDPNPTTGSTETLPLEQPVLFEVLVTDRWGCQDEDNVLVEVVGGPLSSSIFVSPSSTICKYDTVKLSVIANGGNSGSYSYVWRDMTGQLLSNDSVMIKQMMADNTFYAEVNDQQVTVYDTVQITVISLPVVDIAPTEYELYPDRTIITCIYDTVALDAGNPGFEYLWSNGSANREIGIFTTGIGTDLQQHFVKVEDPQYGCINYDTLNVLFTFDACTGISEEKVPDLKVYPNPAHEQINIEFTGIDEAFTISIFDVRGSVLYSKIIDDEILFENKVKINTTDYPHGLYFIIFTGNFLTRSYKVVKL